MPTRGKGTSWVRAMMVGIELLRAASFLTSSRAKPAMRSVMCWRLSISMWVMSTRPVSAQRASKMAWRLSWTASAKAFSASTRFSSPRSSQAGWFMRRAVGGCRYFVGGCGFEQVVTLAGAGVSYFYGGERGGGGHGWVSCGGKEAGILPRPLGFARVSE